MSETVLPKLGIEKIDVISHATGGGGGGLNPIDPTEQEDEDEGVPVSDEGKTLPYESDFISGVKYDNVYGFLGVDINQNFLEGKFVNLIRYIGINDTKYEYATINKDKSHWYKIFIPYKYLEPGLNDVYFYMDDITYKVALELGDEFSKDKIASKLIALENTDGVNVELKLKWSTRAKRKERTITV